MQLPQKIFVSRLRSTNSLVSPEVVRCSFLHAKQWQLFINSGTANQNNFKLNTALCESHNCLGTRTLGSAWLLQKS